MQLSKLFYLLGEDNSINENICNEYINIENDELAEYCHREDLKNGIISSDELPNKNKFWFYDVN